MKFIALGTLILLGIQAALILSNLKLEFLINFKRRYAAPVKPAPAGERKRLPVFLRLNPHLFL